MKLLLFLSAFALANVHATAEAAEPRLQRLEPQGAQRGTELEIKFHGQRLKDGPYQFLQKEPGIEFGEIEKVNDRQLKCVLQVAEDCRIGRHALRLRTASGLSNLVTFHVGSLKEIHEAEPNDSMESSQEIALDVVVNGVVKQGETDVYAVEVEEGERLSVEIEGIRLGRTLFDPLIELQDESGTTLATNDDQPAAQQDAFVTLHASKAGKVFILVRESAFRGSDAATYRLHVGRFPRPVGVFPPAAVAGTSAELRWIGETFGDENVTVEIPETDDSVFEVHASDELGTAPSGVPVYLTESPPVLEVEPNNSVGEGNEMTAPGVACGVISEPKDKDFFRFTMKKGEEFDFRIRARELRSPLDPVLHIFDAKGKYLKGNDDDRGKPDSYLRFKAPADGEYRLDVEDRQLRGRKEMVYAVEISKPAPVADLTLDERRRWEALVINVPQGGRTAAMVTVRRNNFGGAVQVDWNDLPEGSEVETVPLAASFHRVPILFTASPEAELGISWASVTARLTEKPQPITSRFRQQNWLVRGRNNVHVWSHFTDRAPVAVTSALPYSIRIVEPKAPLVRGGSMDIKVVAARDEGFENSLGIRTIYNPPGVSTNQSRSIKKGELEASIPITANAKARLGDWKIAFLARTSIDGAVESSSQLATLKIVEPYFDMKVPTLTVQQGVDTDFVVALNQRHAFEGEAELELIRLPPGVTAGTVKVDGQGESATFRLTIAKDARVGRHRGVGCQARLTVEGEPVRYSQGYSELRVDPAPATKTAKRKTPAEDQAS